MTAQAFGIWGCFILGLLGIVGTLITHGISNPISFAGGASLLLFGAAMSLFQKNIEAHPAQRSTQKDDEGQT